MPCARTLKGALVLGIIVTLWGTGCPQMPPSENDNNSNSGGSANTNENVGEPGSNDNASNDNSTGGNANANDNTPANDNEFDNTASNDNGTQNDNSPTSNDNSATSNQNTNGNGNGNENGGGGDGSNDNTTTNDNTTGSVSGQEFSIEPDDYDDGTDLTDINPYVTLTTTLSDNVTVDSFPVTASDDGLGLAPTGDRVFGHANVQFFNSDRRLRMDFSTNVQVVSILFAGGTFFETEVGRLVAFDENGNQLAEVISPQKGAGVPELLQVTREQADIAWAIAYVAENEGSFGRFDLLSFTLPEEEP